MDARLRQLLSAMLCAIVALALAFPSAVLAEEGASEGDAAPPAVEVLDSADNGAQEAPDAVFADEAAEEIVANDALPQEGEQAAAEPAPAEGEPAPEPDAEAEPDAAPVPAAEPEDAGLAPEALETQSASWKVTIAPKRNTTTADISVASFAQIKSSGEADAVVIDATMSYNGTVTRSVTKTVSLADIPASGSFSMDFCDFGKFTVTARFTKGGATVAGSTTSQTVGIVADEYNIAPLTATMPVTMFSLSLWGDGNIRTAGPTIAMLMRAGAWDWSSLPGARNGMYGVYGLPYLTEAQISYQAADYDEESAVFKRNAAAFSAYIADLYALNGSSRFNLYLGDNFTWVIHEMLYANKIPTSQCTINVLSDGSGSYSSFSGAYSSANPSSEHASLTGGWASAKSYAYANGKAMSGYSSATYNDKLAWAAVDTEPSASWWLARPALLETKGDGDAFGASVRASSKVRAFSIGSALSNVQAAGVTAVAEFKALYNFNDGYFSAAEESGKDVMMFLGTRATSEPGFEDYARFAMAYYGDAYEYYYKGHPATPTDLYPAKSAQLQRLGITDVDSTIAAELILFFNPDIYLSGYASSTYASVPDGMAKGMFNMTKAAGTANELYRNMEFWASPVDGSTSSAVRALCPSGHTCYLVEFSDAVASQKGYAIAIWDATDSVIIYYKLENGTYVKVGSDQGEQGGAALAAGTYVIQSAMKDGQVLDVNGESKTAGANVALWAYGGRGNQQWTLSYDSAGYAVLTNINSGLALDVSGESSRNGTNVAQWTPNGRPSQQWRIQPNADGTYTLFSAVGSNAVLDIANQRSENGSNAAIWSSNGGANQRFLFIPTVPAVSKEGMASLAEGLYALTPAVNPAERLDISGESTAAGANAIVWTATAMDNQVFKISKAESGFYVLTSALSGKVLDMPSASVAPGANVVQSAPVSGRKTQEWAIRPLSGGSYVLQNAGTGLMLEVAGGSSAAGANVQGGASSGSQAQRWGIARTTTARASLDALARQYKNSVLPGSYVIQTAMRDGQVLDVNGKSKKAGANVALWAYGGRANQKWTISYDAAGYASIVNVNSGMALDIAGASHHAGANVRQAARSSSYGQKWIIKPNGDGSYTLISGVSPKIMLDVTNERTANGTNIETWSATGGKAQRFNLLPLAPNVSKVGMASNLSGVYTIAPVIASGRRLDVSGASSANGANVICWNANGGKNQQWRFTMLDDGFYRIESVLTGKALDVSGCSVIPGTNVLQWSRNGGLNQEWAVYRQADGSYTLRNVGTGLMLDLYGQSAANGANVDAYLENGSPAQLWTISKV